MKKIGILGAGNVGYALAQGFVKYGYDVMLGNRNLDKLDQWKAENKINIKTGSLSDAASFGDIIVLAVKGTGAENTLKQAGINNLSGKTILDATNPISDVPPIDGVLNFFTTPDESLMERLQALAIESNFVKAFNSIGAAFMVDPPFDSGKPTMFICGNNKEAKNEAKEILDQFGWDTEDMGTARAAGTIENLCILWCIPGFLKNEWQHAFKLLKKQPVTEKL